MSEPSGKTEPWECTGENLYDACSAFMCEEAQCPACRANVFVLNSTAQEVVDVLDSQAELTSLRAEVERLRAKGEALAKAMRSGMHAAFAQGEESVECACSSCTNRRAALAEWEKP